jgi:hypothetical protein
MAQNDNSSTFIQNEADVEGIFSDDEIIPSCENEEDRNFINDSEVSDDVDFPGHAAINVQSELNNLRKDEELKVSTSKCENIAACVASSSSSSYLSKRFKLSACPLRKIF